MKQPSTITSSGFRLSPNEVARLVQEEREKRRKLRIVQVREQSKVNAAKLRQAVKEEKKKQLNKLAKTIQEEWEASRDEKLQQVQELYDRSVLQVGQAHSEAVTQAPDPTLKLLIAEEEQRKAGDRWKKALEQLRQDQEIKHLEATKHIRDRAQALQEEKARAARIAALPPPPPKPRDEADRTAVRVQLTDMNACSSTYLQMYPAGQCVVDRATADEQGDAKAAAKEAEFHIHYIKGEKERIIAERREKARLRHKFAREKEQLKTEYGHLLHDLSDLQRADVHRRQQVVAKIPKQIFLPPHHRMEEKEDEQQELERAFEDMYLAETDQLGEPSLALDPHPPPETPSTTDSLNATMDDHEASRQTADQQQQTPKPLVDVSNLGRARQLIDRSKTPDTGLRKLLDRIRAQRQTQRSPSAASTTATTTTEETEETTTETSSRPSDERSLTQYTLTSAGMTSDPGSDDDQTMTPSSDRTSVADSLSTGEIESKSGASELGTETASTLEGGTITPSSDSQANSSAAATLLHPMEEAAKVRQLPLTSAKSDLSAFLAKEREKQAQIREETETIKKETETQQKLIDEQRKQLETRLKEIEERKKRLLKQVDVPTVHSMTSQPSSPNVVVPQASTINRMVTFADQLSDTTQSDNRPFDQETGLQSNSLGYSRGSKTVPELQDNFLQSQRDRNQALQQARQQLQLRAAELFKANQAALETMPQQPELGQMEVSQSTTRPYQTSVSQPYHTFVSQSTAGPYQTSLSQPITRPYQTSVSQSTTRPYPTSLSQSTTRPYQTSVSHTGPYQTSVSQPGPYQTSVSQSTAGPYQTSVSQSGPYQTSISQPITRPYQTSVSQSTTWPYQTLNNNDILLSGSPL